MHKKLIIIGVNGHGKVVADIATAMGKYEEIAFLCNFEKKTECMGFPIVGRTAAAIDFIDQADFFVAIGESELRMQLMEELGSKGAVFATLIHPSAILGSRVEIGAGSVVMPGTVLNAEVKIGQGCIINTGASVDHGCVLGDYVHISVGSRLCGIVHVGEHTWIGASATVINGLHVCDHCMIGAGAVVINNIKEQGTYVGVPVRRIGYETD